MLLPENAQIILAETGANDPHFNLRREPVVIQRLTSATSATFVSLLEPHGHYDPDVQTLSASRIKALRHTGLADAALVAIEWQDGRQLLLASADDPRWNRRPSSAVPRCFVAVARTSGALRR